FADFADDLGGERALEIRAKAVSLCGDDDVDPLIALREHFGEKRERRVRVVVEMREESPPVAILGGGLSERGACGLRVQRGRVLLVARRRAQGGRDGGLPGRDRRG